MHLNAKQHFLKDHETKSGRGKRFNPMYMYLFTGKRSPSPLQVQLEVRVIDDGMFLEVYKMISKICFLRVESKIVVPLPFKL